ncbi:Adenylosuccinate synthetase, chloroplastic [Tetrabaena socialis]|uniref:Adenylosuccinate synthetase, chloroplastic n=1 Tax=Tetrabaena socialis TaxID=47790 RepID=A0A2J7ZLK3_9CHLO|nr:Adenylosuccinate synthetase, chloroplastic [Tetrabaena socialis]|eukprot:PNH01146.1 Adenylosuccinate synthetase, chloroplastic [Tetrabaena socialis]
MRVSRASLCWRRYAVKINGLTHLNITKLDVLSELDDIKIGVGYKAADGTMLRSVPADLETLESVEVVYESMPGWKSDISGVRSWDDMPLAAKQYVQRIEDLIGVHCKWIGVGPGRDALVTKPEFGKI